MTELKEKVNEAMQKGRKAATKLKETAEKELKDVKNQTTADTIEAVKKTRETGRKAKNSVMKKAEDVKEGMKAAAADAKEMSEATIDVMADQATATQIEIAKHTRQTVRDTLDAGNNAAESIKDGVKQAASDAKEVTDAVTSMIEDQAAANEISVKKGTAKVKRTIKETITSPVDQVLGDLKDAAEKAKLASEMESGKTKAKRERKTAETKAKIEETLESLKSPAKKAAAAKLNVVIQSQSGGAISVVQLSERLPKDATDVYVKAEENRAYYVLKNGETGSIIIWE